MTRRVVVIGNIALDETLAVEAFPRPGASVAGSAISEGIGGKGTNQAIALARAMHGVAAVRLIAVTGSGARGDRLRDGLAGEPLEARLIARDLPTDRSVILRDRTGENTIVTTQDCAHSVMPDAVVAMLEEYFAGDALVLQGNLRPETTQVALDEAGRRGIWRVFNPSPAEGCSAPMLDACDLLVLNEGEAETFGGAARLSRGKALVHTLGPKGAEMWQDGARRFTVAGTAVEAIDPTGAGDCFLGALVASMLRRDTRQPDPADVSIAAWAAGLCVSRLGTQAAFPTVSEFNAAFAAQQAAPG